MSRCCCRRMTVLAVDGHKVDVLERIDTRCPTHGFPDDRWYAGHPLRRHALEVDRITGERMTVQEARHRLPDEHKRLRPDGTIASVDGLAYQHRYRLERPSETYKRLIEEMR